MKAHQQNGGAIKYSVGSLTVAASGKISANTFGYLGATVANLTYLALTVAAMPFTWFEAACGRGASVMVHARPRR